MHRLVPTDYSYMRFYRISGADTLKRMDTHTKHINNMINFITNRCYNVIMNFFDIWHQAKTINRCFCYGDTLFYSIYSNIITCKNFQNNPMKYSVKSKYSKASIEAPFSITFFFMNHWSLDTDKLWTRNCTIRHIDMCVVKMELVNWMFLDKKYFNKMKKNH